MAISGEKSRRPLTFPDIAWAQLDDEAKEEKVTVSEIVLRYISVGHESLSMSTQATGRRLDQLGDEIHDCVTHQKAIQEQIERQSQQMERGLDQMRDEIHENNIHLKAMPEQIGTLLATVIDGLKAQQSTPVVPDETMESRAEALQRWYAMNRKLQAEQFPDPIPDVPQRTGLWAWVRWLCGARY